MPPKRSTRATQPSQTTTTTTTRATRAAAPTVPAAKPSRGSSTKPPTVAPVPIEDGDTDDSDALLISTRPGRISSMAARRAREPRAAEEDYTMTGGLGAGGAGGGRNARTRGRVVPKKVVRRDEGQARALEALRRRREEAEGRGGDAVEEEEEGEEEMRGRQQRAAVPSSSPAVPATASRVRRASSSHWHNAPPSAVKAQGTPAADTSVLALSKFRRRPRQPSLLRMMQQSDVENEDEESADESGLTLDYSLGDFEPDHESTPLNLRKGGVEGAALGSEPRTASSRKRKLAERGREEVLVPRSSPPVVEEQEVGAVSPPPRETSSERLYSEASELPPLGVADTQPEPADEMVLSETMAPPRSTSPLSSIQVREETPPAKRPRRAVAVRNTTADSRAAAWNAANDEEDHAADPLSSSDDDSADATETPVRSRNARKKTNARKPKAMSLSTATLQSLLPRRRKKPATRHAKQTAAEAFEIPSSDVEGEEASASDDEDELHRAPAAAARRRKGRAVETKRKDAAAVAVGGGGGAKKKRLSRTYGRRSSDKENHDADADASTYVRSGGESDGDGDEEVLETSEMRDVRRSRELEAAAKKFAEVDEWEMEFESVDLGGASASSPWR
ncbi:hypothetical protein UCRNP2_9790 [Neofusicoccum parvum UCRNP2]|uniref:Uncharacterized protein n=1 Tax=Botryosphaeria parva (strain UCR-NP2) TaxID=1287680 RepID=R1G5S9_BOTPV|nr:hypothetical protein UCRNP2_9790 [Neofusicoccum parvum UCRNP2]